ncbi:type II secretion system minor pseudopilin GspJ, partial [Vibrio parahaemolyticus]
MWRSNPNRANKRRAAKGFTLIEVLVSIAIFASLSVAAYQVVSQVQRSNELSQERTQRLNELQRAMVMMDNDFRQMALRQTR